MPPPIYANGALLARPFEIIRRIGEGGMGVVYEALDNERQQRVALKSITHPDPTAIFRFKREFRALADIAHPNLVPLYELVSDGEHWFFTMQLVEGVDLAQHLRPPLKPEAVASSGTDRHAIAEVEHPGEAVLASAIETAPDRRGALDAAREQKKRVMEDYDWTKVDYQKVRSAFAQLASAVRALHEANRLHRDLKPSNVLVRQDGTVVVLDFGLVAELEPSDPAGARAALDERIEAATAMANARSHANGPNSDSFSSLASRAVVSDDIVTGTIPYMAPEQVTGDELTPACDWYAFGVMLFQVCTGRLPHEGAPSKIMVSKVTTTPPSPIALNPTVPRPLDALCVALLAQKPEARPHGSAILEQLGAKRVSQRFEAIGDPSRRAFVGRRTELAALAESLKRAREGSSELVCIRGAHGGGKSSLIDHFARVFLADATLLRGRCFEHESVPFKAIDGVIDALVRHLLSSHGAALADVPAEEVAALVTVFPVMARSGAVFKKVRGVSVPEQRATVEQLALGGLRSIFAALARERPLVIVIEDAQWADVEGLRALARLWDSPAVDCMVVFTSSDVLEESAPVRELAAQCARRPTVRRTTIELGDLPHDDARQLVRALLARNKALAEDDLWVERIVDWSDGSPWLIELLIESHVSLGAIARGQSLDALLRARASVLSESQRALLEVICVASRRLTVRVALDAALGRFDEPETLTALSKAQLAKTSGPTLDDLVEPFHPRVRDAIVRTMGVEAKQAASEKLARATERAGRSR